jgi:hypothetical protein
MTAKIRKNRFVGYQDSSLSVEGARSALVKALRQKNGAP